MAVYIQRHIVSDIGQSLRETGSYLCPVGLEGFYKLATSKQMMDHLKEEGALVHENISDEAKQYISPKEEKDSNGKIKITKYKPKELEDIADKFLKDYDNNKKQKSPTLLTEVFRILTSHYFEGKSILNHEQYCELETMRLELIGPFKVEGEDSYRVEVDSDNGYKYRDKLNEFIEKLPRHSIYIIVHLLFLEKLILDAKRKYGDNNCHAEPLRLFFRTAGRLFYDHLNTVGHKELPIFYEVVPADWSKPRYGYTPTPTDDDRKRVKKEYETAKKNLKEDWKAAQKGSRCRVLENFILDTWSLFHFSPHLGRQENYRYQLHLYAVEEVPYYA